MKDVPTEVIRQKIEGIKFKIAEVANDTRIPRGRKRMIIFLQGGVLEKYETELQRREEAEKGE